MVKKFSEWYQADDGKHRIQRKKAVKAPRLRRGLVPGKVLILLSGRFRGKRVVFLKQLTSGLLLVTGPFKINGVPLKRVNQAYTLSTSTTVDIKGIDVSKIEDKVFLKEKKSKATNQEKFFAESKVIKSPSC